MSDLTAVSSARTALYDALVAAVEPAWRVHRVTPAQIAAPTVFIGSVELALDNLAGAGFIVVTFPVTIVADGAVRPQIEALDDLLAKVWTAGMQVGDPSDSRPVPLDVGGPTLRAHIVRVDIPVLAITLCPPTLVSTSSNGGT